MQDIPHTFSFMQSWQMANPQRQCQQKVNVPPQQWQVSGALFLRPQREALDRDAAGASFVAWQGFSIASDSACCCDLWSSMLKTAAMIPLQTGFPRSLCVL
ncbi:MAG: hypothetical protein P8X55_17765 [Desulfosarcinaceae bacterium]